MNVQCSIRGMYCERFIQHSTLSTEHYSDDVRTDSTASLRRLPDSRALRTLDHGQVPSRRRTSGSRVVAALALGLLRRGRRPPDELPSLHLADLGHARY